MLPAIILLAGPPSSPSEDAAPRHVARVFFVCSRRRRSFFSDRAGAATIHSNLVHYIKLVQMRHASVTIINILKNPTAIPELGRRILHKFYFFFFYTLLKIC